jgi:hypothetical protein
MLKLQVLFILPALLFFGCVIWYQCDEEAYNDESNKFCKYENESINIFHKCQNSDYDHSIQYCYDGIVKDKEIFADERDGKIYKYVI